MTSLVASSLGAVAWLLRDGEVLASLESKGMKVNRVKDVKPFRAAVGEVYDKARESIGADLLKEALAAAK